MNIRVHVEAEGFMPQLIKALPQDGAELYQCRAAAVRRLKRGKAFRVRLALAGEVAPGFVALAIPLDGRGNPLCQCAAEIHGHFDDVEVVVWRSAMRYCALMERGERIVRILVVPDRRHRDAETEGQE